MDSFERLGEMTISDGVLIDTSSESGGSVVIRGGSLRVDNSFVFSETLGGIDGAAVGLDIEMTGPVIVTNESLLFTDAFAEGNAGDIRIRADRVDVANGAQIGSNTSGSGQGSNITIRASDTLTVTGSTPDGAIGSAIFAQTLGSGAGGETLVEARMVTLSGGGTIDNTTFGSGRGGNMTIRASDTLTVTGSTPDGAFSSGILARARDSGSGGDVRVEARAVTLSAGGRMSTSTFASGQGGNVTIRASDAVTVTGATSTGALSSSILVQTEGIEAGSGAGGQVLVEAPVVTLSAGGTISARTAGSGQGGNVTIRASETITVTGVITILDSLLISRIGAQSFGREVGSGAGGEVLVEAPVVILSAGGQIVANTLGPGRGGNVTVRASDALTITGSQSNPRVASAILATTHGREAGGTGGEVLIEARMVTLSDGGIITSRNDGSGQGGNITVRASETLTVTGRDANGFASAIVTRTTDTSTGQGGDITVHAREVQLTDGATITAESTGTGNAGNITLSASETFLSDHSIVTTEATQADGGNITLMARDLIQLRDSQVEASVGGGADTVGGNITIDPDFVIIQNSRVVANAFEGRGGNIQITAQRVVLIDPRSVLDASSALGIDGSVDVQAPLTDLSGTVVPLPERFAQAGALLASRCADRLRQGGISSLAIVGRDGIPPRPGSALASPIAAPSGIAQLDRARVYPRRIEDHAPEGSQQVLKLTCR